MKKILIVLAIVVVVLAGGTAILVANLDKIVDSRKDYLLAQAETKLGREVTVDDVGVTLLGGIGVRLGGVTIADDPAFSSDRFVTAEDLTVRVKLWPLLKKRLEVKRLVLNKPVIRVIRNTDGVLNVSTIAAADTTTEAGSEGQGADVKAATPAAAASLVLAFADIEEGTVRYDDRQAGRVVELDQIDLEVKNAGLGQVAEIKFAAAAFSDEQNIELEGKVGPVERLEAAEDLTPTPVSLKVSLGPLAVDKLRTALPDAPQLERLDDLELGDVNATLEITGTVGALELSDATVTAAVLGAPEPNLHLRLQAQPVNVVAALEAPPVLGFSGKLDLKPIPLAKIAGTAGTEGGGVPAELKMTGDGELTATFSGTPDDLHLETAIDLTNGAFEYADQFRKPAGQRMTASSKVALSTSRGAIEEANVTFGDLVVDATGSVDLQGGAPLVDLSLRSNEANLASLAGAVPAMAPFTVGGTLKLVAKVKGALIPGQVPTLDGSMHLREGTAKLEQMPEPVTGANADLVFTGNSARLDNTSLKVGRSTVRVAAEATSLRPLSAKYQITSPEAFRTDFQTPPKPSPRPEVLRDVKIAGRIWQDGSMIRHEGKASSSSGTLANVDYRNLNASIVSVEDRIDITQFSANALGGTVEGNGTFEPKQTPPKFEVTTRVRKVNLAEYFKYKVKSMPKFIEGSIDLDLDMAGAGKTWDEVRPTLTGTGGAVVIRGVLNYNIVNELISGLQQEKLPLIGQNAINTVRNNNPKLFSGSNTAFKDLRANIRIQDGRIHSKGLMLKTSDYSIHGDGWLSFDRQLGIKGDIVFSQQVTQNIVRDLPAAKYLTNDSGQLVIPLTLTGEVTHPKIWPDVAAITNKLQSSAIDSGIDEITDKLGEKLGGKVGDMFKGLGKKKSEKPDSTKSP
jgi:uncharacterized protein involved in outer membrane biogenesis